MTKSQEQIYNDLVYAIRRGGGKIVSPLDALPIIFEVHLASTLPQDLAFAIDQKKLDGVEISLIGTERVLTPFAASETHSERHFGQEHRRVVPHAGFTDMHRYGLWVE